MRNRLAAETSPYLLQHKDNPVHWQPWDDAALDQARRENKPILLSIGYAACHWCHVMAHESFETDAIAGLMNKHFVNIKVDREERPDLDIIYQTALGLMGEHGGWPLTMFLTPEGNPFWGGTYFPPAERYGLPSFPDVLKNMEAAYRTQKDRVLESVAALTEAMRQMARPAGSGGLSLDLLDKSVEAALERIDPVEGGAIGAPKFPQPPFFTNIWRGYKRTGSAPLRRAVTLTLDKMCQGGIYDHLGGGFARYSTDEIWLAPHFEKMLYDNALIIDLLCEAWRENKNPVYAARVRETVKWVMREMKVGEEDGGGFAFASALDADSEGVEGKFYVWSAEEIAGHLGGDAEMFNQIYGVTARGNWEGKNILTRRGGPELIDAKAEEKLADCREILFRARRARVRPGRDDKVLADWNGLMIAALAHAGTLFGRDEWVEAAKTAFAFVCARMVENGRLRHSWCAGRLRHAAVLDDCANMSRAAIVLYAVTGEAAYLDQAEAWVDTANRRYWDGEAGGYFFSADDTLDVITRTKTIADNATPPGNGVMVEVLARLYFLTGKDAYRERAEELVRIFSVADYRQLINFPTLLNGFEILQRAIQVVIVGNEEEEGDGGRADMLFRTAFEVAPAAGVLVRVRPGDALPRTHPAAGKGLIGGKAAAYVCRAGACGLPLSDIEDLKSALGEL